jgi:ABC-2 type transport system permease protein
MNALAGTGAQIRLALRRDRAQLAVWSVGVPAMMLAVVASVDGLYADATERAAAAAFAAGSPLARAFDGPASGSSLGAMTFAEAFVMLAVLVGLMSTFGVVRHTRQNEETGRAELVGSAVVGRHAGVVAALVVMAAANLAVGAGVVLALLARGLPTTGSLLAGVALSAVGIGFAGVGAVSAQVFESSRGANGAAAATVGLAFLLRAVGDASGSVGPTGLEVISAWPSWLSPIGWGQQTRPYHQDQWEALLLLGAFGLAMVVLALVLVSHRDLGTGMLPVRRGPARADERLLSPFGLAWRLQRGAVVGWLVGLGVLAAAFGALGDEAGEIIATSGQLAEAFEGMVAGADIVDVYLAVMLGLLGTVAGGFVVQSLLRLRAEELSGAAEGLLATAVSRQRWAAGHVAVTVLGVVALLVGSGLAAGLAYGLAAGDPADGLGRVLGATVLQIAPTFALAGFVLLAFGLLPRWMAGLAWGGFVACLLLGQIGGLLDLPQAALNVSPYTHVPQVPAASMVWTPIVALSATALVLGAAGFAAFRRRDLLT